MKALVAQALTGTAGLTYVDVDAPVSSDAVNVDVGAAGIPAAQAQVGAESGKLVLEP